MGVWGPALFSDDTACDVRSSYRELIEDGLEDDEAQRRVLTEYRELVEDPNEGRFFGWRSPLHSPRWAG